MIFFAVFGLGSANGNNNGTVSVTDTAGRTVQVPVHVNKVVATGCSAREVVYLNASDKLVGVERVETNSTGAIGNQLPYIMANPQLMNLPVVGDGSKDIVNYEEISTLNLDVVFARDAKTADTIQNKTGIPTVVVYTGAVGTSDQMNQYENSLKVMGKVLGKEKRADELINYINSTESDLENRTKNVSNSSPTVYLGGQAYRGAHGITSTNPNYPPFNMVNAKNVFTSTNNSKTSADAVQIDKEQIINWNPDVIFIEESGLTMVMNDTSNNPEYKNIKAIQDGKVYGLLPYCSYSYNKDEMFANAYYIGKVLYPDQFKDVDPEKKADEIFTEFDGKPIYNDLKSKYGGFKQLQI